MRAKTKEHGMSEQELDAAMKRAADEEPSRHRAVAAKYDAKNGTVVVTLATGVWFTVPSSILQGLAHESPRDLARVEICDFGSCLHWKALDVDHYVPGLLEGRFGNWRWMSGIGKKGGSARSEAKTAAARENGKKGGRPKRTRTAA